MKPVIRLLSGIILICFVSAIPLYAQAEEESKKRKLPEFRDTSRRLELSGFFVMQGEGLNLAFVEGGADEVSTANMSRRSFELTLSYYLSRTKKLGIEATFGYTIASGDFQIPIPVDEFDGTQTTPILHINHDTFSYQGNFIYNFGRLDIVPFVTLGGGFNSFSPDEDSVFPLDGSYPNISLGAGIKYFVKEWLGIRVQVSDYYYFLDKDDGAAGNMQQVRFHIGGILTF